MSDSEKIRLELDLGQSAAEAKEVAQAVESIGDKAEKAAKGADKLEQSTDKLGKSSGVSSRAMLELGRGVQDFAAGGLLGITNNVEGLATSLGLGAGVAGTATLAVVGLQLLTPVLTKLAESLGDGDDATRATTHAIEELTKAGAKLKEQLGDLKALSDSRVKAIDAENAALERQIQIEDARHKARRRALDQEAKEQAEAAAMEGAPSREEAIRAPSEHARAAELRKVIGGDPEAGIIKNRVALAAQNDPRFFYRPQAARDAERDRILGAFYAGHQDALSYVIQALRPAEGTAEGYMPMEGEAPLRGRLEQLTPGAQAAQKMRDIGGTVRDFVRHVDEKTSAEAHKRAEDDRQKAEAKAEAERRHHDAQRGQLQQQQTDAAIRANTHQAREKAAHEHREHLKRAGEAKDQSGQIEQWMEQSGLHQRAAEEAAMMREQGGYVADNGRFVRTGREGQERRLAEMIQRQMAGSGLPPMLVGAHAGTAAMRAGQAVDHQAQLNQQLMANQAGMANNQAQLQAQLKQARAIGQRADRMGQQMQQPLMNGGW